MKIHFVNGPRAGGEVEFALPEITIGREDGNILRIPTPDVSRYHARIWLDSGQWFVGDQSSTNGIKLNGTRISGARPLADGDMIELGKQIIRVSQLSGEAPKIIFNPVVSSTPVEAGAPLLPGAAPGTAVSSSSAANSSDRTERLSLTAEFARDETPFFFKDGGRDSGEKKPEQPHRFSNRFYYILIACLAVIGISGSFMLLSEKKTPETGRSSQKAEFPLALYFERRIVERDNVFLFSLSIEGRHVVFTIDDVKSRRHFRQEFKDKEVEGLDYLRSTLEASGVLDAKSPPPQQHAEAMTRKLVVAIPPRLVSLTVAGSHAPTAFEKADAAIRDFADTYNLQTISQTREELEQEAKDAFLKAEDLFANCEASPKNLRDAISRYKRTISYLEQFSPKPKMYTAAKQRLEEAQQLRRRKLDDLKSEYRRHRDLKDLGAMRQVLLEIMSLTDPDSDEYRRAQRNVFIINDYNRKNQQ